MKKRMKHVLTRRVSLWLVVIGVAIMAQACQKTPQQLWEGSGHADATAEAFRHWDGEDPAEVPTSCARCHSTQGFQDFVGADGTSAGSVENPVPAADVQGITCDACHSDQAQALTSVKFPSGETINGLGREAICSQCHQGRESGNSVTAAVTGIDADNATSRLGFKNIHYYAAAATLFGTEAKGGYEYPGTTYPGQNSHSLNTCLECHNQHSLEVDVANCTTCHTTVQSTDDLKNIRLSSTDYDGDGDTAEGIYYEIAGLRDKLLSAMQTYAKDVCGKAIAYSATAYPYFFIDTNGNGRADEDEAVSANKYDAFSPRLLKAAYNYQVSIKDPGAFAHNSKYILQLLQTSLDDIVTAK